MRSRMGEMALEAVMVVFAVLVALGVEEWREERTLRDFAGRAEASVMAEIRANLDEFEQSGPTIARSVERVAEALAAEDIDALQGDLEFELPDISSAAWAAAQSSQAAPYLDYAWVIEVGRLYEAYETYERLGHQSVDAMGVLIGPGPTLETLRLLYGRLVLLDGVHEQLEQRFEQMTAQDDAGS